MRLGAAQVEQPAGADSKTDAERARGPYLTRWPPWFGQPRIGSRHRVSIISSFLGISRDGAGNIGAVAPGVAQALTATAFALAVAIPAVFGYNIFANQLNGIDGELEGFGSELIALLVREGRI